MAKKKTTAVNYLLVDDSGSMFNRMSAVTAGMNKLIGKLKAEVPDSELSIIYFGQSYAVETKGKAKDVNVPHYHPQQNCTALYNGIITALSALRKEKADYKSLTIVTDGLENVNNSFLQTAKMAIVNARKNNITVALIATGVDANSIATGLGIDLDLVANFASDNAEVAIGTMADVQVRSSKGQRTALTSLERAAIEKSPEEIAKEEGEELVTLAKLQKMLTKMYEEDAGQFFSVCFKSRTPPYKTRTYGKARFNVPSKVKGDAGKGAAYSPLDKKLVACYVLDKYPAGDPKGKEGEPLGFRSVPLEGIIALRAGGKAYRVKTGG